ncbi:MAG TPA: tyrosine-type recombinase/integrase [Bryobacteraceae bacterium]|nr:tyrosine-type recombinase/integrase [Bryobacteraceae bacterium]
MPGLPRAADAHELITDFLAYGADEKAYSKHTLKGYRSTLNGFARYLAGIGAVLVGVTAAQLIAYDAAQARRLRPRSRARYIAAIRAFYLWLTEEKKVIGRNPSLKLKPPTADPSRRSCPLGEVRRRLIDATERLKHEHRSVMARAALGCMFNAGLRPDDVCQLHLEDVIWGEEQTTLIIQSGKGNKRADLPIATDLADWLRAYLAIRGQSATDGKRSRKVKSPPPPSQNFFVHGPTHRPITQVFLRSLLAEVKAVAGIRDPHLTPHSLRHSFASTLYEEHTDLAVIQELLRHESVETTRIYVHPTDKRKYEAVQKLNKKPAESAPKKIKPVRLLKRQK